MALPRLFLVAALALVCVPAHACLHYLEDTPLAPPKPLSLIQRLDARTSRGEWEAREQELRKIADKAWNYPTENNLSVALCHIGKVGEALDRMRVIERTAPGHMETAYNMATALELSGDLVGAKSWLQEGFARERKQMGRAPLRGTEWLHERILDAAIADQSGEKPVSPVSGLDFGEGKTPQMPAKFPTGLDDKPVGLQEASRSLFAQLHERLEFAPAPNPVVGDLLFDLANSRALDGGDTSLDELNSTEVAPLLKRALDYGSPRAALVQRRFDYFSGKPNWPMILAPFALGIFGWGAWKWEQARRERQLWAQIPVTPWEPPAPLPHLEWKEANENTPRDLS